MTGVELLIADIFCLIRIPVSAELVEALQRLLVWRIVGPIYLLLDHRALRVIIPMSVLIPHHVVVLNLLLFLQIAKVKGLRSFLELLHHFLSLNRQLLLKLDFDQLVDVLRMGILLFLLQFPFNLYFGGPSSFLIFVRSMRIHLQIILVGIRQFLRTLGFMVTVVFKIG
jgi:hypothetical protein